MDGHCTYMTDHNFRCLDYFQYFSGVICRKLLAGAGNTASSLSVHVPSLCGEIIFPMLTETLTLNILMKCGNFNI
jgi:hypothetical protein